MVEDYFSIAGFFLSEMCTKHCKAIGPPKATTWDHTRQSIKQAKPMREIQPVVPYFLQLP